MYNQSYLQNKASLRRCEQVFNIVTLFYLVVNAFYILSHLYIALITPNGDTAYYFLDGVVLKIPFLTFGFLGCYHKKNIYAILAPVAIGLNTVIYLTAVNEILSAISIAAAVITCIANKKYHELEQCEGFPHFNERFTEVNDARIEKRDVYKEQLEFHKSRAAEHQGEMDEL